MISNIRSLYLYLGNCSLAILVVFFLQSGQNRLTFSDVFDSNQHMNSGTTQFYIEAQHTQQWVGMREVYNNTIIAVLSHFSHQAFYKQAQAELLHEILIQVFSFTLEQNRLAPALYPGTNN